MITIPDYLKLDYAAIAQRLSKVTGKTITPSQLEVFANAGVETEQSVGGILSGLAIQDGSAYWAEFRLRLPTETLTITADDPAFARLLKENVRITLARLVYLAEDPSEGVKVDGGRELHSFD